MATEELQQIAGDLCIELVKQVFAVTDSMQLAQANPSLSEEDVEVVAGLIESGVMEFTFHWDGVFDAGA